MVKQVTSRGARRRAAPQDAADYEDVDDSAHLALAISRILAEMGRSGAARYGDDLVELIEHHLPAVDTQLIADPGRPRLTELRALGKALGNGQAPTTPLDRRIGWLSDELGLHAADRMILGVLVRCSLHDPWHRLLRLLPPWGGAPTVTKLAILSGLPASLVDQHLAPGSPLRRTELVRDDGDGEYAHARLLSEVLRRPAASPEQLVSWLMPDGEVPSLSWDDFAHLPLRDLAAQVLAARQGVSVLLFGEPGTGKTEFARVLAARARCVAIFAGRSDESGSEPCRRDRIAHLMTLRPLCQNRTDRIIVVDEADDILAPRHPKFGSKQWVNLLVEQPQVPTIWIVNDQDSLDPAVLRRMTLAIGFKRPPVAVRRIVIHRAAQAHQLLLTPAETDRLAAISASPAVIASGIRAASLAGSGADAAHQAIASVVTALGHSPHAEPGSEAVYDPALASADLNLADLAQRLAAAPSRNWSLLLAGPSGTGKTAYARHLAAQLGLEVEERRGSDLLGPYVGESEARIAGAFAQATARGALLLIDEIDSFLGTRAAGQRSWERQLVNEMLQQLEQLRTPFVATTNLAELLDPAAQRRFILRVTFQTMSRAQVAALFRARFGQDWPAREPVPAGHTPGDFAVVARRAELLGETRPSVLLGWLHEEIAARGDAARPIGFVLSEPAGLDG